LRLEKTNNYTVVEGSNKGKILEKYLCGNNENGEISMFNLVNKLENKRVLDLDKQFENMDIILDPQKFNINVLDSHQQLALIVSNRERHNTSE
jgi:hypothetical protein